MNNSSDHSQPSITLEDIIRMKKEKLEEIRASKERIHIAARDLFHPNQTEPGIPTLMNNFNSGIAIFNGIMTGFKIIKRIRSLFRHKNKY